MEKEIRIALLDGGKHGEVFIDGKWLYVKSVKVEVRDHNRALVVLVITPKYCDITYDAKFEIGVDDNNDR